MRKYFALIITLALLLASCGKATVQPTATATAGIATAGIATAGIATGGTVVLIIPEEPTTLNYYASDAAITRQVADATSTTGLTMVDEKGDFYPVLATDLPTQANGGLSADNLKVTWKLRPDLKWSDGQPLTSDDIKFTWEVISDPTSGALSGTGGFGLIQSVETPDTTTAVVTYSTPYPGYLAQFMWGLFPRHAAGAPADMTTWAWDRQPVGAGPFIVTDWQSGASITLERNPYFYLAGKPYLDKLVFRIVPEPAAQSAMMMQGEAQVQLWPGMDDKASYDNLMAGKATETLVPGVWNMAIDFNLSKPFDGDPGPTPPHPILGDLSVRQAIAHAIDYDTLVHDVLRDTVAPSTSPFAYGWYQCDIPRVYPYDPEKAKQLLDQAGWVVGSDGIRVAKGAKYAPDGTRLSLELQGYTNFEPLQRTEEFIVDNLKTVGIEARIQNYDFSIIFGSWSDNSPRMIGDYDMLIYDRSLSIEPQGGLENLYLSSNFPTAENPSGGNVERWQNTQADQDIQAAGSNFDLSARKQSMCDLGNLISTELPQLYMYLFQDGYGFSTDLTGYTVSTWGSMVWDVENWQYK